MNQTPTPNESEIDSHHVIHPTKTPNVTPVKTPMNYSPSTTAPTTKTSAHFHRMSSTSDEDFHGFESNATGNNEWQIVKTTNTKRRKINASTTTPIEIRNTFNALSRTNEDTQPNNSPSKIPKPPPIYIYGVVDYAVMARKLKAVVKDEEYTTKCLADNTIKVNSTTPESYRKLVKFMRDSDIIHHTNPKKIVHIE
ncbi:uncharacterized protein LOC123309030 [Coccinella septempunctata]|uniref:uncharacterized protein LOC123309030 n=1 Tax=Coccinella septempunctata TaxID=41139 RepID=UPI001D073774|nr:uncharacterized protein LOC123309030 [Coccinella septempunctata]